MDRSRTEIDAARLEAEIYFGSWVQKWFSEIVDLDYQLSAAIQDLLAEKADRGRRSQVDPDYLEKRDEVLYGAGPSDLFEAKVSKKVDELRERLKEHFK